MKPHPREVKAKVVLHRKIGPESFRLQLSCPEIARLARPGQFAMLRVNDLQDPFLRRPFSFSRIFLPRERKRKSLDEGGVEICYQTIGHGTRLMTQIREGQRVDLLGPLGNGFWVEEKCRRAILVGGGIGVAPLLALAQERAGRTPGGRKSKGQEEAREVLFLVGARSKERILCLGECRKAGIEPQVATEDGSLGKKGLATDLLERELLSGQPDSTEVYACGPRPMLARIAQMVEQFDLPCQVLLESRMACGVGACLGCTVKVRPEEKREGEGGLPAPAAEESCPAEAEGEERPSGEGMIAAISEPPAFRYVRVCKEGPVFDSRKIFWD